MSRQMEPPEPTCGRCGNYVLDEDRYHCPHCGEDLIDTYDEDNDKCWCEDCGRYTPGDELAWHCSSCNNTSHPEYCDGCGKVLHPKIRGGLCRDCQFEEQYLQGLEDDYLEELEERYLEENK